MPHLIEFLRESNYELAHPEALGLPPTSGQSARVVGRAREYLIEALLRGDESRCRQIAIDLYLAEHSLSVICDDLFAEAFRQIGHRWSSGEAEIYQERRGCELTLRVLHDLRALLALPSADSPLAIGGTTRGDHYSLGTTMAELVLTDVKWNAVQLGENLPFHTLAAAIRKDRPKLFWLSCSHITNKSDFITGYNRLYDEFGLDVAFVVGGYALTEEIRQQMKYAAYCDNMQHLEGFAQSLRRAIEKESATS
jgi:methanogenic corrinoid protein MtbC1